MADTELSVLYALSHLIFTILLGTTIISVLQVRDLRLNLLANHTSPCTLYNLYMHTLIHSCVLNERQGEKYGMVLGES